MRDLFYLYYSRFCTSLRLSLSRFFVGALGEAFFVLSLRCLYIDDDDQEYRDECKPGGRIGVDGNG